MCLPSLLIAPAEVFDTRVDEEVLRLVEWQGALPEYAKIVRGLAFWDGGLGVRRIAETCELAFTASFRAAAKFVREKQYCCWYCRTGSPNSELDEISSLFRKFILRFRALAPEGLMLYGPVMPPVAGDTPGGRGAPIQARLAAARGIPPEELAVQANLAATLQE